MHGKTSMKICANNEDSCQPAHPHSLTTAIIARIGYFGTHAIHQAKFKCRVQGVQMLRLI